MAAILKILLDFRRDADAETFCILKHICFTLVLYPAPSGPGCSALTAMFRGQRVIHKWHHLARSEKLVKLLEGGGYFSISPKS